MYQKYCEHNNWKLKSVSCLEVCTCNLNLTIEEEETLFTSCPFQAEMGVYKTYVMEVKGKQVYSKLKFDSGVHRVQRVPLSP